MSMWHAPEPQPLSLLRDHICVGVALHPRTHTYAHIHTQTVRHPPTVGCAVWGGRLVSDSAPNSASKPTESREPNRQTTATEGSRTIRTRIYNSVSAVCACVCGFIHPSAMKQPPVSLVRASLRCGRVCGLDKPSKHSARHSISERFRSAHSRKHRRITRTVAPVFPSVCSPKTERTTKRSQTQFSAAEPRRRQNRVWRVVHYPFKYLRQNKSA